MLKGIINALLPIGWPSKAQDFDTLANKSLFFASEHNSVKVTVKRHVGQHHLESFPLPKSCDQCHDRFESSGIAKKIAEFEWEHVAGSQFNPSSLVSLYLY